MGNELSIPNALKMKSYTFAIRAADLYRYLTSERQEYTLADRILRSGTSLGVRVIKGDAVQNLEMALREAVTAESGICLCRQRELISHSQADTLIGECRELQTILVSSISSVQGA